LLQEASQELPRFTLDSVQIRHQLRAVDSVKESLAINARIKD